MAVRIAVLTALIAIAGAAPQISYPLNSQLPPVARVDEPYLFQFAPTTFTSDSGGLVYSLDENPSWLTIDEKTGTLSGTPGARDVGTTSFTIVAAEAAGAVANMQSTLLVTKDSHLELNANISRALSAAGPLSGPTTVSIQASQDFQISFPSNLIDSEDQLSYFATLSDHTPLPAWLSFDPSSLRFAGTAPPTSIPQSFGVLLIASNTPGYAASTVQFALSISVHQLYFQPAIQTLNVSKGDAVHITGLKNKLFLDRSPISDRDIQSPSAELPDWLSFDAATFDISGTAPGELSSQALTISAKDIYGDLAQYTIHLNIVSELFSGTIGTLNITLGEPFKAQLPHTIFAEDDEVVTIDFAALADHMHFNPTTFTIFGTIPEDTTPQVVRCSVSASSKDGTVKEAQAFNIALLKAPESTSNDTKIAGHGDTFDTTKANSSGQRTGVVVGIVLAAICGAALLAACIFCVCKRRKQVKSYLSPKPASSTSPRKSTISRPTFIPIGWPDIEEEDLEKGKDHDDVFIERTPDHAPKLDLNLPHDRRDSASATDSIGDADTRILEDFGESSWGYIRDDSAPSDRPHDSMKIAVELAKRSSQNSIHSFRKHTRRTTTVYRDQIHRSSGLPVHRRIIGMGKTQLQGHGRHTYSPSRSNNNFGSLRRAMSSSSYSRRTSSLSTVPTACPQAPTARSRRPKVTTPTEERHSIRVVPTSSRSSLADRRTIEAKRSSYIRKRASAQSPFFSAGYRASSSSYRSPPAFLTEKQRRSRHLLLPSRANTIVKPDDDVEEGREKEVPGFHQEETPERTFPGSLRKHRSTKSLAKEAGKARSPSQPPLRPATTLATSSTGMGRRASTRKSLLASELKATLNDLTGSEIYDNADLSESVYTDEEDDIEDYDRRTTVKPGNFTLPPLQLDSRSKATRDKRSSKRNSQVKKNDRELKRTSEREPTPHYLAREHGGKENISSTYSLGKITPIPEAKVMPRAALSPVRPTSSNTRYSQAIAIPRKSVLRDSQTRPVSQAGSNADSNNERHSRRSLHSRQQSRVSGTRRTSRGHSRSQSSAFPFFDPNVTGVDTESLGAAVTTPTPAKKTGNKSSVTRDLSGNLIYHGDDTLGSSSMVFNGPPCPAQASKRFSNIPMGVPGKQSAGLGLFPQGPSAAELNGERERNPLSVIGASVGVEKADAPGKERRTWGEGLKSMIGRSSMWTWEKEKDDVKVFM
ncbi:polarity establishment/cellular polarization [Stagonosporopsis vannaccii]|nr:polarity establishment/cellular polarization [Stagonosporopsis vannaccii]